MDSTDFWNALLVIASSHGFQKSDYEVGLEAAMLAFLATRLGELEGLRLVSGSPLTYRNRYGLSGACMKAPEKT